MKKNTILFYYEYFFLLLSCIGGLRSTSKKIERRKKEYDHVKRLFLSEPQLLFVILFICNEVLHYQKPRFYVFL
ncbi:hypothetical protein BDF14DRAFT_1751186 [Spinellus fusiger]|nr:hypothetical protein BDF14DRAFT_1751186 [Spinellus fusiger]